MIAETQALLGMFGLPYVVAPMEAEAQCAAMELDGLTKGWVESATVSSPVLLSSQVVDTTWVMTRLKVYIAQ